jgi:hypothetical protein
MEQDILSQMEGRGLQYQGLIAGVNREARLNAMLHQIRETISTNYNHLKKDSREFLTDFVSMETMEQVDLMNSAIRMPMFNVVMTQNAIETIVDKSLIRGAIMSNWWDRQQENAQNRIITQIQLGFAEGEGIGDLRRRIIGKATGKWRQVIVNGQKRRIYERVGGIVDVSKREADALVRTAVQTLSGQVRTKIYEQNDDIVDQVESVATLDARTTPLCASYDNLRWTQKSHSPVGHRKMYLATPRHWNCRSTHIPVMRELERLEKQAREAGIDIPQSMRASIDGPQPAMRSMDDWLKSKPPEFQRQIIGSKRKTELFNEGKISLRDLTDDQGKVRTIRELMHPLKSSPDGLPYAIARKPVLANVYDSFRRNILQEPGVSLSAVRPDVFSKYLPPELSKMNRKAKKELGSGRYLDFTTNRMVRKEGQLDEENFYTGFFGGRGQATALLEKATEEADVFMAIRSPDLKRTLDEGKFKNSLESGKGSFKTNALDRVPLEREVFGITADVKDHDAFPKYGFLSDGGMTDDTMVKAGYGDVFIKFKKDVRNRSTFTIGDSYDSNSTRMSAVDSGPIHISPPTSLANPKPEALVSIAGSQNEWGNSLPDWQKERIKSVKDIASLKMTGGFSYIEAQVYGELLSKDISEIYVGSKKKAKAIQKLLKKNKLDHIKIRPLNHDERLKTLWGGYIENLSWSLKPTDIDNLGQPFVDKIGKDKLSTAVAVQKNWQKNKTGRSLPEWTEPYLDKYITGEITPGEIRSFTRKFYETIAKKEEGGFPDFWWKDYRATLGGFTEDVMDESLLEAYR